MLTPPEEFAQRLALRLPDALDPLHALYPEADLDELTERFTAIAARIAADRKPELRALDRAREIDPMWFQHQAQVGYVAYVDRFAESLVGVASRLDYLQELGVTYFHVMSVLASRSGENDGGYAIIDYRGVDPAVGTIEDLAALADQARARGMSLCVDLVMNHTAQEHEWARKAQAGDERYQAYYLTFPDRIEPNAYEASLPEVFPDMAPGNFTWNEEMSAWVWTTFHNYQWDLNYRNPDVLAEMLDVMGSLVNQGIDVLRLDAVAFTWKRLGTNCQNQPEAHLIVQVLRAFLAMAAPGAICKAEAIVGPNELVAYLGGYGEDERRECELAYHNQLMVMGWSSLASGDARLAIRALNRMTPEPTTTRWCTYVRCHDDIGWAITDEDASAAGIDAGAHRRFLAEFYRGDFPTSFARGIAFGSNPLTGDERTSGTASALCGIDDACRRGDDIALDLGIRRLHLLYGLAISFGGIPLIYMGDELALGNDFSYLDHPDLSHDSRWIHRPKMDWKRAELRHDPATVEGRVFGGLRHLLKTRAAAPAFRGGARVRAFGTGDDRVLGLHRHHPRWGSVAILANFSPQPCSLAAPIAVESREILNGQWARPGDELTIEPFALAWLVPGGGSVLPRNA